MEALTFKKFNPFGLFSAGRVPPRDKEVRKGESFQGRMKKSRRGVDKNADVTYFSLELNEESAPVEKPFYRRGSP